MTGKFRLHEKYEKSDNMGNLPFAGINLLLQCELLSRN